MFNYYLILVPIVALALIIINYLLATSNPYVEKDGPFECGFSSFLQSRSAFNVAFILIAILFLPFDLEISSLLPYTISSYLNNIYGLTFLIIFFISLSLGFIFEYNLHALKINRIYITYIKDIYRLISK
jgi:NADH-ubiquinone oxidoreductase chain 3